MDENLKTVLTLDNLLRDGVPEAPLPIMQFNALKEMLPRFAAQTPTQRRTYNAAANAASRAKKQLTPEWENYYFQRNMVRQLGGDPSTVVPPGAKQTTQVETPEARRERLLSMDLRRCKRPSDHRRGDRSVEAQEERDALWQDQHDARALQKERASADKRDARVRAKRLEQLERELSRHGPETAHHPEVVGLRNEVVSARGRAQRAKPWVERVLDDLLACARNGRPAPRCLLHRRIDLPLHMRPHHPSSD